MSAHYEYGNTRVKVRKSFLLKRLDYERFIALQTVPQMIASLSESAYAMDMEHALIRYSASFAVSGAAKHRIIRELNGLRSFYKDESRQLVDLYLSHWDLFNLKTILRGVARKSSLDEIQSCLIPSGDLDEAVCLELARQPDLRSILNLLRAWNIGYARAIQEAWPIYMETGLPAYLEIALERYHYRTIEHSEERFLSQALKTEMEIANLAALLALADAKQELTKEQLKDLLILQNLPLPELPLSIENFVSLLRGTPYQKVVERALPHYMSNATPTVFQTFFEDYLLRQGEKMFREDPLGLGVIIGIERAIVREAANLRLIAQAKESGMSYSEIWNQLIIPFEG